jgi:hypothetical protein
MGKRWKVIIGWQNRQLQLVERKELLVEEFSEINEWVERHLDWNAAPFINISLSYNPQEASS